MNNSPISDFLAFRTLITPILIQVLFWLSTTVSWVLGLNYVSTVRWERIHPVEFLHLLFWFVLAPLLIRLTCESLIVFFTINSSANDIRTCSIKTVALLHKINSSIITPRSEEETDDTGWEEIDPD